MKELGAYCLIGTPFSRSGEIDEAAFRAFLNRFIDARIGVYVASGGNGEGHAMSGDDLRRLYAIAVDECRGKIPVEANLPEAHTASRTIEQAQIAVDAGVDVVHFYALEGRHGMKPTDDELKAYFDTVLTAIKHPAMISANPTVGQVPSASLLDYLCKKYPQVLGVRISNMPEQYLIGLKDGISREVTYTAMLSNSIAALAIGIDSIFGSKANVVPKTVRQYMDACDRRDLAVMGALYSDLKRFQQHVTKWAPGGARWIKMAMKALKLPGGEGTLRPPYMMPKDDEMKKFTDGLLKLRLPEIDEMARAAGLASA